MRDENYGGPPHGLHGRHSLQLWTAADVATTIDVTVETLAQWRQAGTGPNYVKLGKAVFYRRSDIAEWIDSSVTVPGKK